MRVGDKMPCKCGSQAELKRVVFDKKFYGYDIRCDDCSKSLVQPLPRVIKRAVHEFESGIIDQLPLLDERVVD